MEAKKYTLNKTTNILNEILSDEFVLQMKTLNYHWNVTGPLFAVNHKTFGDQYKELTVIIDDVAERIRAIGGIPIASLGEIILVSDLEEHKTGLIKDTCMVNNLFYDHSFMIRELKIGIELSEKLKDHTTNNLLIDILSKHEKMAWMLKSHIDL